MIIVLSTNRSHLEDQEESKGYFDFALDFGRNCIVIGLESRRRQEREMTIILN
jgi:hypothetical protein